MSIPSGVIQVFLVLPEDVERLDHRPPFSPKVQVYLIN